MTDVASTVRALLDAAGLIVSDEEFEGLVRVYPELRARADSLYQPAFLGNLALDFDPSAEAL